MPLLRVPKKCLSVWKVDTSKCDPRDVKAFETALPWLVDEINFLYENVLENLIEEFAGKKRKRTILKLLDKCEKSWWKIKSLSDLISYGICISDINISKRKQRAVKTANIYDEKKVAFYKEIFKEMNYFQKNYPKKKHKKLKFIDFAFSDVLDSIEEMGSFSLPHLAGIIKKKAAVSTIMASLDGDIAHILYHAEVAADALGDLYLKLKFNCE